MLRLLAIFDLLLWFHTVFGLAWCAWLFSGDVSNFDCFGGGTKAGKDALDDVGAVLNMSHIQIAPETPGPKNEKH